MRARAYTHIVMVVISIVIIRAVKYRVHIGPHTLYLVERERTCVPRLRPPRMYLVLHPTHSSFHPISSIQLPVSCIYSILPYSIQFNSIQFNSIARQGARHVPYVPSVPVEHSACRAIHRNRPREPSECADCAQVLRACRHYAAATATGVVRGPAALALHRNEGSRAQSLQTIGRSVE